MGTEAADLVQDACPKVLGVRVHIYMLSRDSTEINMLPNLAVITFFGKLCLFREYFGCDWEPKGDLCFPIE